MAVVKYVKETDLNCNGLRGWFAFGQYYTVIGFNQTGTNSREPVWGWVDVRDPLSDLSRQSRWSYIGSREYYNSFYPTFLNEVTGVFKYLSYYTHTERYTISNILFCGCGIEEIDCTNCCVACCSVASEFLEKLKG